VPEFVPFELEDSRTGWTFSFGYFWDVDCHDPSTPPPFVPPQTRLRPPPPTNRDEAGSLITFVFWELFGVECLRQTTREWFGYPPGWFDEAADEIPEGDGFLSPGRSFYVGSLEATFEAWDLVSIDAEMDDVAFGLGQVQPDYPYGPPTGTWWVPEFFPFELNDGRTGWAFSGAYHAVADDCDG
jgi:hypothetical protein